MSQDEKDFDLRSSPPTVTSSEHLPLTTGTFSSNARVIQGRLSRRQCAATNQRQLGKLRPAASPWQQTNCDPSAGATRAAAYVAQTLMTTAQCSETCPVSPASTQASKQASKLIVNKTNQITCFGTEHRRSQSEVRQGCTDIRLQAPSSPPCG